MSGVVMVAHTKPVWDVQLNDSKMMEHVYRAARREWVDYARLRGFVPVTQPSVTINKPLFKIEPSEPDVLILLEGWCRLHSGPGIAPDIDDDQLPLGLTS